MVSLIPFTISVKYSFVLMSIFSNSVTNFSLFQITFPFVSIITSGNGEFINVVFAVVFTFSVRSFNCSDNSAFLFLFDHNVYKIIKAYIIIPGNISLQFNIHKAIIKSAIIIKYIFVLDINVSQFL